MLTARTSTTSTAIHVLRTSKNLPIVGHLLVWKTPQGLSFCGSRLRHWLGSPSLRRHPFAFFGVSFLASTEHASEPTQAASGADVKPPDSELRRTPLPRKRVNRPDASRDMCRSGDVPAFLPGYGAAVTRERRRLYPAPTREVDRWTRRGQQS